MRQSRPLAWPFALLLLCLGVMVTTALVAWQGARRHRRTAEQLLLDYGRFAAWNAARYLGESLGEMTWTVVNPVMHRELHASPGRPDAEDLVRYRAQSLRDCNCDPGYRPEVYFGFRLGDDEAPSLVPAGPEAARVGVIRDSIERRFLEGAYPRAGMLRIEGEAPRLVGYGIMPTVRGDTMVYGFAVEPASLADGFGRALASAPLLPAAVTEGRATAELVAIEITARDGALLYRDTTWAGGGPIGEERLRAGQAGLVVRARIAPGAAATLVGGGLPDRGVLLLVAATLLAAVLALLALLQLRREGELARVRSEFVASVSHELRTPLAQLRLYLDTLRLERYATAEQRDWILGHLARETTRLEQLVESVLAFARLERTEAPGPAPEPLHLAREIAEAVALFQPIAAARGARLETDLDTSLHARIDATTFRQVVLNLLDNAIKFGPRGQRVRVELSGDAGTARLTVRDEGPGVPVAERLRIWEPYYRGASPAVRAVGGSGIGLALVSEAVRRAGGVVRVEDGAPGARFLVELPGTEPAAIPDQGAPDEATAREVVG